MTASELIQRLQAEYAEYWTWLLNKPNALARVKRLAQDYKHWPAFAQAVLNLKSFQNYLGGIEDDPEEPLPEEVPPEEGLLPEEDIPPPPVPGAVWNGDGTWTLPNGAIINQNGSLVGSSNILATLTQFLADNELPASLINFIRDALAKNKPSAQIIAELRETPEYKEAYPENDIRRTNNLPWISEAEIRAYRDEARRLSREYMGIDVTNIEIASLIGRGVSLRSWEHRLQVNDAVERWGGAVQQVFEAYTGAPLSNERLHMFFDPDMDTSQIDNLYEMALRRGQPTTLGFAIRPEEEARLLQQMGISVDQVFRNYQQIRSELPRFERLAAIGRYLDEQGQDFFGDVSVSGSLLFRAVQLGDPEALKELKRRSSEEAARWQAIGGPTRTSGGVVSGLSVR